MNEIIELIIITLATFGTSTVLTSFPGPWNIFIYLRKKLPNSPLDCIVCTSVWVGILFFVVFLFGWGIYLTPLAILGVVILLERI